MIRLQLSYPILHITIQRPNSLKKALTLGKLEGRRRRQLEAKWMDSIKAVRDRSPWRNHICDCHESNGSTLQYLSMFTGLPSQMLSGKERKTCLQPCMESTAEQAAVGLVTGSILKAFFLPFN